MWNKTGSEIIGGLQSCYSLAEDRITALQQPYNTIKKEEAKCIRVGTITNGDSPEIHLHTFNSYTYTQANAGFCFVFSCSCFVFLPPSPVRNGVHYWKWDIYETFMVYFT